MGKTRTLGAVAQRAREIGLLVLAGGCYEQEGRLPYGPLSDALLDYLRAQPAALLQTQLAGLLPELARVVPDLEERIVSMPTVQSGEGEEHRLRLFWALSKVLERISQQRPLVVLLDDLHWADDATLQVLHFLVRQPTLHRLLIVGTYRQDEVPEESVLARLVAHGERAGWAQAIVLQPFEEHELAMLLEKQAEGQVALSLLRAVHERSAGNPFFALEMLMLLQQEGRLKQTDQGWQLVRGEVELPAAAREAVGRRLRHLEPETREVLALGAILGREFPFAALGAMWQEGEGTLFQALGQALESHLLDETDAGYAFHHPLLREVVYARLPAHRRSRLHERAGLALEALCGFTATAAEVATNHMLSATASPRSEQVTELARHFLAAGHTQHDRAASYLTMAGDVAAQAYAWQDALRHYTAALERTGDDDERRAALQEKVGATRRALGRYDEALEALEEASRLHQARGDLEREGLVVAQIGEVHFLQGTLEEGRARLQPVLDRLEKRGPSHALAALYATWIRPVGTSRVTGTAVQRAVELARAAGDDALLVRCETRRALMLLGEGRLDETWQVLEGIIPVAEACLDHYGLGLAIGVSGELLKLLGQFEQCRVYRNRGIAHAERVADPALVISTGGELGEVLFLLGDWEGARACFERTLQIIDCVDSPWHAGFGRLGMATLELAEGNRGEAVQLIKRCLHDAERLGHGHWSRNARRLLALADLRDGLPTEALRRLRQLAADEQAGHAGTLVLLAWAYLDGRAVEQAGEAIERAISLVTERNNRLDLCEALLVQGRIHAARAEMQKAQWSFTEARALAAAMPHPYAEARILFEQGQLNALQGEIQRARMRLEEALAVFRRLGARKDIERTDHVLIELARV
jgi:tetratricopeptide (TPR) repeat protein